MNVDLDREEVAFLAESLPLIPVQANLGAVTDLLLTRVLPLLEKLQKALAESEPQAQEE